jgi:hypothetical protein
MVQAQRWYTARSPSGRRVVAFVTDRDLLDRELLIEERFIARLAATSTLLGS